jgi:hypothetical protein
MVRLTRRGFTAGTLAIVSGACGAVAPQEPDASPVPPPEPSPGGDPPPFGPGGVALPPDPGLAFGAIAEDAAPPTVIWSWTTVEQAAEIRRDGILFTRESSPTLGKGLLFDVLDARAAAGDAAAARLTGTELAKGRFGWHNPWATILGAGPGETYGLELLRIEMRADTWFARVRASQPGIDFVDAAGKPIASASALASFERVGGILFENDVPTAPVQGCWTGSAGGGAIYREIYVGNEARLATFSHRTSAILSTIDGHIAELSSLRAYLLATGTPGPADPCSVGGVAAFRNPELTTSRGRYLASLAFATSAYAPDAASVGAIIAELQRARFTPDPYVHPA